MSKTNIILPYRGEFGHKLMTHVPLSYAIKEDKVICCEKGDEILYPNAKEYITVPRFNDAKRRQHMPHDADFIIELKEDIQKKYSNINFIDFNSNQVKKMKLKKEFFIPKVKKEYNINADVVICPRKRKYGNNKNWKHWKKLSTILNKNYSIFAAGAPDSSAEIDINIKSAYDYPNFLEASIQGILKSKVVICTDAGLGYLALLCAKPIIMISYEDKRTAPGYKKININRFQKVNHKNQLIIVVDNSWESPNKIVVELEKFLKREE